MKSVNSALKQALAEKLEDIGYPVYSGFVPADEESEAYLLISDISSESGPSTMSTDDTNSDVQIGIYTRQNLANSGDLCDQIAEGVYQRLKPNPESNEIDLEPFFQNCGIQRVTDRASTLQLNSFIAMNRFITFSLLLYHK